jgi:hypothetical protein
MSVAPPGGQDRIMIYGPKTDGTYIIEFRMADGESLAISVPASETRVLKHFQARMPYGLVVPDGPRWRRSRRVGGGSNSVCAEGARKNAVTRNLRERRNHAGSSARDWR